MNLSFLSFELLIPWSVSPPLLLIGYYYWRVKNPPSMLRLLMFFIIGAISGFISLGLGLLFEYAANLVFDWQNLQRSLFGVALRQLIAVGPIEEGCKLAAVVIPTLYLKRYHYIRSSTILLCAIAVGLGFTAQENWVYFHNGIEAVLPRLIGTPVHAMFAAPWGYALAVSLFSSLPSKRKKTIVFQGWLNSVISHALVNVLSSAWRFSPPVRFLSYGLFPFLVLMFWRLEQLLRKSQGKNPIILISGFTRAERNWRRGLVAFALILGGNAIFGIFLLSRSLSPLSHAQIIYTDILWLSLRRIVINIFYALIACGIYWYLRRSTRVGN